MILRTHIELSELDAEVQELALQHGVKWPPESDYDYGDVDEEETVWDVEDVLYGGERVSLSYREPQDWRLLVYDFEEDTDPIQFRAFQRDESGLTVSRDCDGERVTTQPDRAQAVLALLALRQCIEGNHVYKYHQLSLTELRV